MTLEALAEKLETATRELQIKAEMLWEELVRNEGGKDESNRNSNPGSDCPSSSNCGDS